MSFRLVPKSATLNDLNGVMAVILRYFTDLVYDVIVKQLPPFQNPLLIVSDHIQIKSNLFANTKYERKK